MKLPYFFIYAKDKKKEQVNLKNKSAMNRIAEKIPDSKIIFLNLLINLIIVC